MLLKLTDFQLGKSIISSHQSTEARKSQDVKRLGDDQTFIWQRTVEQVNQMFYQLPRET